MGLLKQNHVKYGLIMSIATAACLLLMEVTGQGPSFDNKSPFEIIFLFTAPAVVWFLGIKAKRKELKGKLTFMQGVTEGFKISLVYGIISPFIFLKYYIFVNPQSLDIARTAYGMAGASDAMVIGVDMLVQFVVAVLFGTIYGTIISLFLKTKNR